MAASAGDVPWLRIGLMAVTFLVHTGVAEAQPGEHLGDFPGLLVLWAVDDAEVVV